VATSEYEYVTGSVVYALATIEVLKGSPSAELFVGGGLYYKRPTGTVDKADTRDDDLVHAWTGIKDDCSNSLIIKVGERYVDFVGERNNYNSFRPADDAEWLAAVRKAIVGAK
jgi:hypothetical protein